MTKKIFKAEVYTILIFEIIKYKPIDYYSKNSLNLLMDFLENFIGLSLTSCKELKSISFDSI